MIKEPLSVEIHRQGFGEPVRVDYRGGSYAAIPGLQAGDYIVTPPHGEGAGSIQTRKAGEIRRQVLLAVPSRPGASLPVSLVRVDSIGGQPSKGYRPAVEGVEPEAFDHGLPADCCPAFRAKVEAEAKKAHADAKKGGK